MTLDAIRVPGQILVCLGKRTGRDLRIGRRARNPETATCNAEDAQIRPDAEPARNAPGAPIF